MAEITVYDKAIDKGLEGVVACSTAISTIEDTTLNYRGYTIEDLAHHSSFEETVFLLWNDRLPNSRELELFSLQLRSNMVLPENFFNLLKMLPVNGVHPMTWLRTAVSLLAHVDPEAQDNSAVANQNKSLRLTARMSTLVCALQAIRKNQELPTPRKDQSVAWNFLYMLQGGKEPNPEHAKIFDTCLILHADHELNCSAFAARVTASSLSDLYSAVVSAIAALKGPLHGGANEQVLLMLQKIGTVEKAKDFVKNALANKEKVMGIGHRVYKNGDPRAAILKKFSEKLTAEAGLSHLYQMSVLIDQTMYQEKGLMPNVDFYSATVYHSMNIPSDLFTPIFAASRIAGWCAHVLEQYGNNRIYRPRGKWVGASGRKWLPVTQRG
ncbi:MAG: citrate synthase [Bdellovibrionaceae bacterium]|nr:citrate synthase [Pseudobdellovibrionaceae bacterium]MDW8190685.1 citrate synthase [Pseudobdellovibrionaceae bacterium]